MVQTCGRGSLHSTAFSGIWLPREAAQAASQYTLGRYCQVSFAAVN